MAETNAERVARFYNERYRRVGETPEAVGWASRESQQLRFGMLFRDLDPRGRRILDVGCGLGDLVVYLDARCGGDYGYVGVDIAEDLVGAATQKHGEAPNRRFAVMDAATEALPSADIVVASGAFTLKLSDTEARTQSMLRSMFRAASCAVAANFMTSYVDFEAPKNHHFDPAQAFSFAKTLTPWVALYHDYPLWEFSLQLLHAPRGES